MNKAITQEQVDRAAKRVLSAAKKYGNHSVNNDYSDDEQGALLGAGAKYADVLRGCKVVKQLYCIQRDMKRGNKILDHLVANHGGTEFAYGSIYEGKVRGDSLVLLDKAAAETLAKIIGRCQAVPYEPPV
jgi:hypothetical protein